ncbi:MAG: hypothetical protein LBI62_10420 [Candidatus Accumulibacter sp.]|nr:hypothetical protein [Accumulibacter sp.]
MQGSDVRDQGSGIRDQGSGIRDQGSGIRDQGSVKVTGGFAAAEMLGRVVLLLTGASRPDCGVQGNHFPAGVFLPG